MKLEKNKTAAFAGYSNKEITETGLSPKEIHDRTLTVVYQLYQKGYRNFITRMDNGFELIAATAVITARNPYPDINIIVENTNHKKTTPEDQELREKIKSQAKYIHTPKSENVKGIMSEQNTWMLDKCSMLVCFYDETKDTLPTVEYAKRRGIIIVNTYF